MFFCLFFPALMSVGILGMLQKKKFDVQGFLTSYASFVVLINFLVMVVLAYVFGNQAEILTSYAFTNGFIVKFLACASVFAVILPFVFEFFRKNTNISLEVVPLEEGDALSTTKRKTREEERKEKLLEDSKEQI